LNAWPDGNAVRLHALHCLARVALRVRPPMRAKALVDRMARRFPPLRGGIESARDAVDTLFPTGSCLSRAVAIAAVLPGAQVVLGVDAWSAARVRAHAWLEIDGVRVDTVPGGSQFPDEIARFPRSAMTDRTSPP
jgi:hypothetical protein